MHRSALLATALAVVTATALSSCSGLSGYEEGRWATHADLMSSSKADHVPSLVADDATDIRLREPSYTSGPDLLAWKSASGITRDDCRAGALTPDPGLTASWWPSETPKEGWSCGWWRVFEHDGTYYAWDHHEKD